MATDRHKLYNAALRLCGERRLSSVDEARGPRYLLDDAWDNDGVRTCLEAGQWRFAIRSVAIAGSTDFEAPFGYDYQFEKMEDLVRVVGVAANGNFDPALTKYIDEGDFWYASVDPLYVRYVSDDNEFGMDFAKWPPSFSRYVEAYLASKIIIDLTSDEQKRAALLAPRAGLLAQALSTARANDAIKDPTKFMPTGSWVSARSASTSRENG